jgi:hypothetical protein
MDPRPCFLFPYLATRIERMIPPPVALYARIEAVFDFVADQLDHETGNPLFNAVAKCKADLV